MSNLNKQIKTATKWSAIAEIAAKLITPITSMVLARLLTPEAFGVVTTLTMIITFAEIFTDAGFQKYLIQHEFVDVVHYCVGNMPGAVPTPQPLPLPMPLSATVC